MRKQRIKTFALLLTLILSLSGCGEENQAREESENYSQEANNEQGKTDEEKENLTNATYSMEGFLNAGRKYEDFNSYASENGLDGTSIYVEGKVIRQTQIQDSGIPVLSVIIEQQDGKQWCVAVTSTSEIEEIEEKEVRVFGTYQGFSDVENLPAMGVFTEDENIIDKVRIQVKEDGEYKTVWNFFDYVKAEIDKTNNPDGSYSESKSDEVENKEELQQENDNESESVSTLTTGQRNALKSAKNYLSFTAFSYEGLIDQLEYEKYSHDDSVYAADNCGADWNEQALKSAKNYLSFSAFSYKGLIEQLEYEQFTTEQATYAADNCGADWNEQAAKSAENYLSIMSFSKDELIEQLEFEGFTHDQAVYGAEQNGY